VMTKLSNTSETAIAITFLVRFFGRCYGEILIKPKIPL
jgi:hypothetical protein